MPAFTEYGIEFLRQIVIEEHAFIAGNLDSSM